MTLSGVGKCRQVTSCYFHKLTWDICSSIEESDFACNNSNTFWSGWHFWKWDWWCCSKACCSGVRKWLDICIPNPNHICSFFVSFCLYGKIGTFYVSISDWLPFVAKILWYMAVRFGMQKCVFKFFEILRIII